MSEQSVKERIKSFISPLVGVTVGTAKVLRFGARQLVRVVNVLDKVAKARRLLSIKQLKKMTQKTPKLGATKSESILSLKPGAVLTQIKNFIQGKFSPESDVVSGGSSPTGPPAPETNAGAKGTVRPNIPPVEQGQEQGGGGGGGLMGMIGTLLSFIPGVGPVLGTAVRGLSGAAGMAGRLGRNVLSRRRRGSRRREVAGVLGSRGTAGPGNQSPVSDDSPEGRRKSRFARTIEMMNERRRARREEIAEEKEKAAVSRKENFQTGLVGKIILAIAGIGIAMKSGLENFVADLAPKLVKGALKLTWEWNKFWIKGAWDATKWLGNVSWEGTKWLAQKVDDGLGRLLDWFVNGAVNLVKDFGVGVGNLALNSMPGGRLVRSAYTFARDFNSTEASEPVQPTQAPTLRQRIRSKLFDLSPLGPMRSSLDRMGVLHRDIVGNQSTPFDRLRFAQYGFTSNERSHFYKLFNLERLLQPHVVVSETNGRKTATLTNIGPETESEVLRLLELDPEIPDNVEVIERARRWLNQRFLPAFLRNHEALRNNTSLTHFEDLPRLRKPLQRAYLEDSVAPAAIWDMRELPLKDPVYADGDAVLEDALRTSLLRGLPPRPVMNEEGVLEGSDRPDLTSTRERTMSAIGDSWIGRTLGIGQPEESPTTPPPVTGSNSAITSMFAKLQNRFLSSVDPTGALLFLNTTTVHGLITRIRFAQYGLGENRVTLFKRILKLEHFLLSKVNYTSPDSGQPFTLKQLTPDETQEVLTILGVTDRTREGAGSVISTSNWFTRRFVPVFLHHLKLVKSIDVSRDLFSINLLTPLQMHNFVTSIDQDPQTYTVTELQIASLTMELVDTGYVSRLMERVITQLESLLSTESQLQQFDQQNIDYVARARQAATNRRNGNQPQTSSREQSGRTPTVTRSPEITGDDINLDSEPEPSFSRPNQSTTRTLNSRIRKATGDLYPGGSMEGLILEADTKFDELHPQFKALIQGMASEYFALTGKKVDIGEAFRTYEDQARLYREHPDRAAKPGNSIHESGLAIDADERTVDELERLGLMAKYGLTRPIGREGWHIEPIAVSMNARRVRTEKNPALNSELVQMSVGRGGGGYARVAGSVLKNRDYPLQNAIFNSHPDSVDNVDPTTLINGRLPSQLSPDRPLSINLAQNEPSPIGQARRPNPTNSVLNTPSSQLPNLRVEQIQRTPRQEIQTTPIRAVSSMVAPRTVTPPVRNQEAAELSFFARQQLQTLISIHEVLVATKEGWNPETLAKAIAEAIPTPPSSTSSPSSSENRRNGGSRNDEELTLTPPTEQMSINAVNLGRR